MPHWDLQCPTCGRVYDMVFNNVQQRDEWLGRIVCDNCEAMPALVLRPSASAFTIKGYSAKTGYATKGEE